MIPKKEDRIYAAGLVDGEGCIGINKHKNNQTCGIYYTCFVRIEMTYPKILKWMQKTFGGSFLPIKPRNNCRKTYVWGLYADNSVRFLSLIQPYTKIKTSHIPVITRLQKLQLSHEQQPASKKNLAAKEKCYQNIKMLNQRRMS